MTIRYQFLERDFMVMCGLYHWLAYMGMLSLELVFREALFPSDDALRGLLTPRWSLWTLLSYAFNGRNTRPYGVDLSMCAFLNLL